MAKSKVGEAVSWVGVGALIALILVPVYGWVHNIISIIHAVDAPMTGMFILRCIGIFVAPLGALLGFF